MDCSTHMMRQPRNTERAAIAAVAAACSIWGTAFLFAKEGCRVVVSDVQDDSGQQTVEDLSKALIEPTTRRTAAELDRFFGEVRSQVLVGKGWAEREAT